MTTSNGSTGGGNTNLSHDAALAEIADAMQVIFKRMAALEEIVGSADNDQEQPTSSNDGAGGDDGTSENKSPEEVAAEKDYSKHLKELPAWVSGLAATYALDSLVTRWREVPGVTAELLALKIAAAEALAPGAKSFEAVYWHDALHRVIGRIPEHYDRFDKEQQRGEQMAVTLRRREVVNNGR